MDDQLPNELVQEILSRVRAKFVLRCRSVCKSWKASTSTQDFFELHHSKSSHRSDDLTVLVEELLRPITFPKEVNVNYEFYKVGKKLYMFDDAWRRIRGEKSITDNLISRMFDDAWRRIRRDKSITANLISRPPEDNLEDNLDINGFLNHGYENDDSEESSIHLSFSSCGLVVLFYKNFDTEYFSSDLFIVMNPITREKVKIRLQDKTVIKQGHCKGCFGYQTYGAFFHPVLKEFCLLWGRINGERPRESTKSGSFLDEFRLLNLGPSRPQWKIIDNESTRRIVSQHQQPRHRFSNAEGIDAPVVLDDVLYWMVEEKHEFYWTNPNICQEAILAFDTVSEEFHLLPHPLPSCPCPHLLHSHPTDLNDDDLFVSIQQVIGRHRAMHLLENRSHEGGGHLSLCRFDKTSFSIWIFKKVETTATKFPNTATTTTRANNLKNDYVLKEEGLWIKMRTVNVEPANEPYYSEHFWDLSPIGLVVANNGESEVLLLHCHWEGDLLVYHFKLGTWEHFATRKKPLQTIRNGIQNKPLGGVCGTFMCAHSHTFLPLRNYTPEISLDVFLPLRNLTLY